MPIEIDVLYFAAVRERLGQATEKLSLQTGDTVDDLWRVLAARHPVLKRLRPHLRVAVNHEFVTDTQVLGPGDEVALIPPVAGGSPRAEITPDPLDLDALIRRVRANSHGAVVSFLGVVRDHNRGRAVSYLEYEAYPEMAAAKLEEIAREVDERWPDCAVAVSHRVGRLEVGEAAAAIAVGAPHRKDAFRACEYIIDRIKEVVPIWKREVGPDGAEWVDEEKAEG